MLKVKHNLILRSKTERPYTIVISSKGRHDKIKPLTSLGLPKECFIFCVNDDEEKYRYTKCNPGIPVIVSNTVGCMENRNFFLDYFGAGRKIISVDDDVEGLFEQRAPGRTGLVKMTGEEIDVLIKKGFHLCESNKTKLWGVYPTYNHFYMSRTIVPHGFIVGHWMGIITSDLRFDTNVHVKDDYSFTCQNIVKFKKIVRFNYVCVKAQYLPDKSGKGGASDYRTDDMVEKDVQYLMQKYPNWVVRNPRREGNEILLKFKPVKE